MHSHDPLQLLEPLDLEIGPVGLVPLLQIAVQREAHVVAGPHASVARANGINSVLLVSDPFHMLRSLKMARDLGLAAYGSPTRTSPISVNWAEEARYIVRESWAYLVYLVARQ